MRDPAIAEAARLMDGFAGRTGLDGERPPRRYLWTDAFAVCNWLGLAHATGERRQLDRALRLVEQVHLVLGRHRPDDARQGWLSGLPEAEGAAHPTAGGLRIGKPLPERRPGEPVDERLEWDRDGQYFHYLTKWMHALSQVACATGETRYAAWARELAAIAAAAFVIEEGPGTRMAWKMSVDLSRPLVPSMGQHDPLDGYVTALELEATVRELGSAGAGPGLEREVRAYAALVDRTNPRTADPLGIGGLLADADRVDQLAERGAPVDSGRVAGLLSAAGEGLARYGSGGEWRGPASRRLAFREIGLAIGLMAVERMRERAREDTPVGERLAALARYVPLGDEIEAFWRDPANRDNPTWDDHRDIDEVMLATRLVPEGFLELGPQLAGASG